MKSKLEEAASAHESTVYELYADSHSADSEREGFKAGAKWLIEEARKLDEKWIEEYDFKYDDNGNVTESKTIEHQAIKVEDLEKLVGEE